MSVSASRAVFIAALAGAVYTSLRPTARVESALDLALAPTRALAELAAPIGWLGLRQVRAAESALAEREHDALRERQELIAAERRAALPAHDALLAGRRFVPAEVVGRRAEHFDQVAIELDNGDAPALERGLPVAAGNVLVGRIVDLDPQRGDRAFVELVTAGTFTVGAVLAAGDDWAGEPIRLVVGGVVGSPSGASEFGIGVHNPSRHDLPHALALVDESFSSLEPFAQLAQGFELGLVETRASGEWMVRPRLDYKAGLFRVVVVCPPTAEPAPDEESDELFVDGRWRATRATSCGEPVRAREGLKLAAGAWNGARAGAAVIAGVRLVGIVARAGALSADVRTLGDPGLAIAVIARIEGLAQPIALGRLVSLGRRRSDGALALRWEAVVPLQSGARARLFTASDSPLVPRGLLLGASDLPAGPGPHTIFVEQDVDPRASRALWLRLPEATEPSS